MSKTIRIVDQTIRDAQQSLWGFLMSTDMIRPIASTMDEVGYHAVATVGSNGFVVQHRYYDEDPWERIRLLSQALPSTTLRGSYMTASLASFDVDTPQDVIALWIRRSVAHGVDSFWVCDYQADSERFSHFARIAKDEGASVITSLMYSLSPAHDQEHWARKARLIAEANDCVDAIMIEDASGVLTPESTRALLATVQQNCGGIPLEFHGHCNSGLAPLCYLEAIQMGVETLHTAVAPLANGTSLPSTESIVRNAARLGYSCDVDQRALEAVSSHFRTIAEERGFPVGEPEEYDLFHYEHQVPGGMMTNLQRQLKEVGMQERLDEVLEEVCLIRRELGYPVMATPFSQIVGVQAVENVVSGERYKHVPDTVVKYLLGFYGEPAGPIDPDVWDRIFSLPEAQKLKGWQPQGRHRPLKELRQEVGPELSDDELLLKLVIPGWRPHFERSTKAADGAGPGGVAADNRPAVPAAPPATLGGADTAVVPASGDGPPGTPRTGGATAPVIPSGSPMAFVVEVDGEVFHVNVRPGGDASRGGGAPDLEYPAEAAVAPGGEAAPGRVICGTGGMMTSVKVSPGDKVVAGDVIATIESMKLIREISAPHAGVVQEIHVCEGDMVSAEDTLMVVA